MPTSSRQQGGDISLLSDRQVRSLSWWRLLKVRRTLRSSGENKPRLAEKRRALLTSFDDSLDPRVIPLVEASLQDEWIIVREAACVALGTLQDHDAVPALIEVLREDVSMDVRRAAAQALGGIGDVRAVEPLLQLLCDVPQQRIWILDSIARIGEPAVPILTERLRHSDPGFRLNAVVLLGRIKVPGTLPHLVRMLNDPQVSVRAHAAESLGALKAPEASAAVAALLRDDDASVRAQAAAALARIADPRTFAELTQALGDDDAEVRGFAATALGKLRDKDCVDVLLVMLSVEAPENRLRVVEALGEIRDQRAIPGLCQCLTDPELAVRVKAIESLGLIGGFATVPMLINLLDDSHATVRREAIESLERIGDVRCVGAVARILEYDRKPEVRLAAARALGRLGDAQAIPALESVLHDGFQLTCRACVALGEIGTSEIIDILTPLLVDSNPEIRYHAAVALGNGRDSRAIKPLEALLHDPDPFVLRGLAKAFDQLGDARARKILELAKTMADQPEVPRKNGTQAGLLGATRSGFRWPTALMPDSLVGVPAQLLATRIGTAAIATLLVIGLALGWRSWDKFSNRHLTAQVQRGKVAYAAFGRDSMLTLVTTGGDIEFWDASRSQLAQRLSGKATNPQRVLVTSDGRRLIFLGDGHSLHVLDLDHPDKTLTLSGHKSKVFAWKLIDDEQRLRSVSKDGAVFTWVLATGKARDSLLLPADGMTCATFSRNGELVAVGDIGGQVKLFGVADARQVSVLGAHNKHVDAVAFSHDGTLLSSMAADGSLLVWDTASRRLRRELQPAQVNPPIITSLHFSPKAETLAVGQLDGVVQLWDLVQRKRVDLIAEFPGRSSQRLERIDAISFSHDGQLLAAAGSENRQVAVWDVTSRKPRPPLVPAN